MISSISDRSFVGFDLSLEAEVMIVELVGEGHDDACECAFLLGFNLVVFFGLIGLFLL